MRMIALTTVFVLATSPALAQSQNSEEGLDLMGEALRLFMRGLMQEVGPALEGMEGLLDNLDAYHPPEVLPNGDIIIRRKNPAPPLSEGETEI